MRKLTASSITENSIPSEPISHAGKVLKVMPECYKDDVESQ